MKAYKGFDENFCCRGMQFKVGESYHHDGEVVPCKSGFHACAAAVGVWKYYGPCLRFAEVELFGETRTHKDDSKVAASDIRIVRELSLAEFTAIVVQQLIDSTSPDALPDNDEDCALIGSSGDGAQIGSSGYGARIGSSGYGAQIEADGENAVVACAAPSSVKGISGTWIAVAEYVDGKCVGFATGCIGQDGLVAGVWYVAKGGKLVPR